jgi:citrate lyase beta subunit
MMDANSERIANAVALLTAITSGQEDLAYEMVLETDPVELFIALTGVTMVFIKKLSELTDTSPEDYLKNIGMLAFRAQ